MTTKNKPAAPAYNPANDKVIGQVLLIHLNPNGTKAATPGEGVESFAIACRSFTGTNEDGTPSTGELKVSITSAYLAKRTSQREGWARYRIEPNGSTVLESPVEGRFYMGKPLGRVPVSLSIPLFSAAAEFAKRVQAALDKRTKAA